MGLLSPHQNGHRASPENSNGSQRVQSGSQALKPYHWLPEAAAECHGVFVWATALDTQLKAPEILLRLTQAEHPCGAILNNPSMYAVNVSHQLNLRSFKTQVLVLVFYKDTHTHTHTHTQLLSLTHHTAFPDKAADQRTI